MKPSESLKANRSAVLRLVQMNKAPNPRILGSILQGDDTEGSDLDLLVAPAPENPLAGYCED